MGIFARRVPVWQPYGPLPWGDVRILMLGLKPVDDHTEYLLDRVYRTRQIQSAWEDALSATEELFAQLAPLLHSRCEESVDETTVRQALATGYILALEDVQWGTGQKSGLIHTATHNAICALRHELPEGQLVSGNRALEAGYYLGRTNCSEAVHDVIEALGR